MRIAVGAITRRRPVMFETLLDSLARVTRPDGIELLFVFAENDSEHQAAKAVEAFRASIPEPVLFALEPEPGIPFARNRVLSMAFEQEADFLTFVDDDETVAEDWLTTLVAAMEARRLDLAGGPVEPVADSSALTGWNRAVLEHLQDRAQRRNRTRRHATEAGTDDGLNIYTNNWCLRLSAQREHGIRFDERLRDTGGSDTRFSREMSAAGARLGWVPEAGVVDRIPLRRLSLRYHYSRARDQAINTVRLNRKSTIRTLREVLTQWLEALALLLASPALGRRGVVKAVFKLGLANGQLRGVFGGASRHYAEERAGHHAE
ncbi:glycosyltransferase [Tropicimonas sp. TH_r6]|uniref:glycosyltransferase n=1 Tax=Tropicimonas sp. TH_r6 TaxID=3082085 RepID=UPI002952E5B1|nr:glycosyltransferase [Tropicimonas sp. TH_r6]MDV7141155.1 glycosyltransferase [Tropicimonas sp. TH_r6]